MFQKQPGCLRLNFNFSKEFLQAGVSFGEQEANCLRNCLKIAAKFNVSLTRFFEITGTQSDYYIVEATAERGEDKWLMARKRTRF